MHLHFRLKINFEVKFSKITARSISLSNLIPYGLPILHTPRFKLPSQLVQFLASPHMSEDPQVVFLNLQRNKITILRLRALILSRIVFVY